MEKDAKIYVAGHRGLVGSALLRTLIKEGYTNIILKTHQELDLVNQRKVAQFFEEIKPEYVLLAAAKVGGILANSTYPADFIYTNLMIQTNILHSAYKNNVKRLLFLGSSCIYPKDCNQPIKEDDLMTGKLEPTNSPYAIAKIAGIEMCQAYNRQYRTQFLSINPPNLFGPFDNFNLEHSHVLSALLRKLHLCKLSMEKNQKGIERDISMHGEIPSSFKESLLNGSGPPKLTIWGTGQPKREFLHVDDMADACLFLLNKNIDDWTNPADTIINIGSGKEISIHDLAVKIASVVDTNVKFDFDPSIPDGMKRKILDVNKLFSLGWKPQYNLTQGIKNTYSWYLGNNND